MGALIYMKEVFREFPFSAIGSRNLVRRLKESLTLISDWARSAPLSMWLFFMGGISAAGKPDRAWFVAHLVKVATALKVQSWSDVKQMLEKMLWIKKIHEQACKVLWEEVDIFRSVLYNS
jgi:hypothetical protein